MSLFAGTMFDGSGPVVGHHHLFAIWVSANEMVMEGWKDDCPKLFEESIVGVGVDDVMEVGVKASETGLDAVGLPLDEGIEDLLALVFWDMEEIG